MKSSPVDKLYDFEPHDRGLIPADYLPITTGNGTQADPYVFVDYPSEKVQRAEKWLLDLNTMLGIYSYEIINRERNKTGERIIDKLTLEVSIFDDSVDFGEPLEVYFDVTKVVK